MKITRYFVLLSLVLAISIFTGANRFSCSAAASQSEEYPIKVGIAAKYNGWVYVNQQNYNYKLGRISKSDKSVRTYENGANYTAVAGDDIYYYDSNYVNLVKFSANTGKTESVSITGGYYTGNDSQYLYFSSYLNGVNSLTSLSSAGVTGKIADNAQFLTSSDGYVYYYVTDRTNAAVNNANTANYKLFRAKPDGSGKEQLSDQKMNITAYNMVIKGDSIYYVKYTDKMYLYKSSLDGKTETKICPCDGSLKLSGSWLYFTRYDMTAGRSAVYRINLDGAGTETKVLEGVTNYSLSNDGIYFFKTLEIGILYRAQADGTGIEKVSDNPIGSKFSISDNYIYYQIYEQNSGLLKMNNSGKKEKLVDGNVSNVYLYKNYAYYLNKGKLISRTNLDNGATKILVQSPAQQFRIDGNTIYFSASYDNTLKMVKIDGSGGVQPLNSKFPLSILPVENTFDVIDGYIYYYKTGTLQKSLVRTKIAVDESL